MRESLFTFWKTAATAANTHLNFTSSPACRKFSEGKTEKIITKIWTYCTIFKLDNKQKKQNKNNEKKKNRDRDLF